MHCPILLILDCVVTLERPIDSTCANTINHVKITRSVLGSGHGASLREDAALGKKNMRKFTVHEIIYINSRVERIIGFAKDQVAL